MKRILFLLVLASALLAGCKSAQEKALDAAIATNDLSALRQFAIANGEGMKEKVMARYYTAYNRLEKDSSLYSAIVRAPGILARYKAEQNYLGVLPNGIHAAEVKANFEEHKKQAEALGAYLEGLRDAFKQYKYIQKSGSRSAGVELEFSGPDESGRGEISGSNSFTVNKFNAKQAGARVTCNRSGSYYIDDNLRIIAHVEETRSYAGIAGDAYWNRRTVRDAASKYPAPRPRTITLTQVPDSNFKAFKGQDDSGEVSFEAVLK